MNLRRWLRDAVRDLPLWWVLVLLVLLVAVQ
jgi:hypothetical protein